MYQHFCSGLLAGLPAGYWASVINLLDTWTANASAVHNHNSSLNALPNWDEQGVTTLDVLYRLAVRVELMVQTREIDSLVETMKPCLNWHILSMDDLPSFQLLTADLKQTKTQI